MQLAVGRNIVGNKHGGQIMNIQEKTAVVETAVRNGTYLEEVSDILSKATGTDNLPADIIKLQREARKELNKPTMFAPVEFISLNDIKPKPIQWLIPGVIPKGMITVLASDGGVGKTALSLWLASLVSNKGETFNGKQVEHGRVLI